MEHKNKYSNQDIYSDLDIAKALEDLSRAIRYKTVSSVPFTKESLDEFNSLHKYLATAFPNIFKRATVNYFDKSLLIQIPGTDKSLKPYLLMAHQDVVPAENLEKWVFPPFSGHRDDTHIWGRGTLDIKSMMIAELEALEYLLVHNFEIRRTLYLAYGHNEEIGYEDAGAKRIAEYLKAQNIELELVVDEGFGYIQKGDKYLAPNIYIGEIGIYEKGYVDLELSVKSVGGHSSKAFKGTSLSKLAKAITMITEHPFTPSLSEVTKHALSVLASYISLEPLKTLVKDIDKNEKEILDFFVNNKDLNALVQTTIAPTVIKGSAPASNVLPGDMQAIINFRLNPGDDAANLFVPYRKMIDEEVWLNFICLINASNVSSYTSLGYKNVEKALNFCYQDVKFIPSVCSCATDARYYEIVSDTVLRVFPFFNDLSLYDGVHGINERIEKDAYIHGIKFFINLMTIMNN